MPRYFLEVAYRGTRYSGFQVQENAPTIQSEIERAFHTIHRRGVQLTGSSRTDAGVHALQNFFHFDTEEVHAQFLYKMNAVLPDDIVIKGLHPVAAESHSRFHALSREYEYRLYRNKDPFRKGLAYYFPYKVEEALLAEAAALIQQQTGFLAFSKSNT
ncbi:MAG TPA: tRNA pseudouridine synthase A, partial [Chitinophagaceae bacterium]|nr:tRNA pseudouridine synthase A [Chitinophagaceae bacterium]